MATQQKKGLLVIISSPTGGGKDAIIKDLVKVFPNSTRLVTTTSRSPRPTDKEGETYYFISREDFETKIKEGYFLEYNDCVGNYYGTPKQYFKDTLAKYDIVFSNIDVNGKRSLDDLDVPNLSFFILPESLNSLKQRAEKRGGMTEEMIRDRIILAKEEIAKSKDYDYKVINFDGKLDETVEKIAEIIQQTLSSQGANNSGLTKNQQ
jgi:guanylate kinase